MALVAHIYLAMQRPDLAKKQLGLLQEADDDATLTKLVAAWVALSEGSDKAQARPIPLAPNPRPRASARPLPPLTASRARPPQDALYEFQELGDRYSRTLLLLNGLAACHLQMGNSTRQSACCRRRCPSRRPTRTRSPTWRRRCTTCARTPPPSTARSRSCASPPPTTRGSRSTPRSRPTLTAAPQFGTA